MSNLIATFYSCNEFPLIHNTSLSVYYVQLCTAWWVTDSWVLIQSISLAFVLSHFGHSSIDIYYQLLAALTTLVLVPISRLQSIPFMISRKSTTECQLVGCLVVIVSNYLFRFSWWSPAVGWWWWSWKWHWASKSIWATARVYNKVGALNLNYSTNLIIIGVM